MANVAKKLGRAPSLSQFARLTGISKWVVMTSFGQSNEAVRAAGLQPRRLKARPTDEELLKDWGEPVRKRQGIPSRSRHRHTGKYDPKTLERRFGGRLRVPEAFGVFARARAEWADVLAVLEASRARETEAARNAALVLGAGEIQHAPLPGQPVYGNPMDLRGLRHAPTNEQGVVLLFGMPAKDLG